jgi:hypothetical protein
MAGAAKRITIGRGRTTGAQAPFELCMNPFCLYSQIALANKALNEAYDQRIRQHERP